jgi:hypothetical protein
MKNVQDVTPADVLRVYSGGAHKCMCGCSGKYTTNPDYRDIASLDRGYEVDEDECNMRVVKMILNKCKKNNAVREDSYFYFETPTRIYVVYLKPSEAEIEEKKVRQRERKAAYERSIAQERAQAVKDAVDSGVYGI